MAVSSLVAGTVVGVTAVGPPRAQAAASGTCTESGTTTVTVTCTVGSGTWTPPAGVASASVDVEGAGGGAGGASGASGGKSTATLNVSSGTAYAVLVGGRGGAASGASGGNAGINGGGAGGSGDSNNGGGGGGGGGRSEIDLGATRLVVAGGGGGGGGSGEGTGGGGGAGGGTSGQDGNCASGCHPVSGNGGAGATSGASGHAGSGAPGSSSSCGSTVPGPGGATGTGANGGAGSSCGARNIGDGGGGGGGGDFGGGGGSGGQGGGGGGGGSGYLDTTGSVLSGSTTANAGQAGDGKVTITYQAPGLCSQAVSGGRNVVTCPVGTDAWTVPTGATSVSVDVEGAAGGSTGIANGGKGGSATATLAVTPGASYTVVVGSQDGASGGGGSADTGGPHPAGSGGGRSEIDLGATRLVVAGGGGGAGNGSSTSTAPAGGAGGGTNGGDGSVGTSGNPGTGGSQSTGGTGGAGVTGLSPGASGQPGVAGAGGAGGSSANAGGGGGGGYFGGGGGGGVGSVFGDGTTGGASGGGGGGGSGHLDTTSGTVSNGLMTVGAHAGDGSVTFSWVGSCSTPATVGTTSTITCPVGADTWTVPAGVTSINTDVEGAGGGRGTGTLAGQGGAGGKSTASLSVAPGNVYSVLVGGRGGANATQDAGINGGGAGGMIGGGGGGGGSEIDQGATRLVVAGGGGGGGARVSGPAGGVGGAGGGDNAAGDGGLGGGGLPGGKGANTTFPGAGGAAQNTGCSGTACTAGSNGAGATGGAGGNGPAGGGGGGGGYLGGGGGGGGDIGGAGGGGGSGFIDLLHTNGGSSVNGSGGAAGSDGTVVLSYTTAAVPGAPTLTQAQRGNSQVTLTWTPPTNNGGLPITGYNVYEGTTTGGEDFAHPVNGATLIPASSPTVTYTVTGLTNGQTYYFEVKAVNAAASSPASNELSATPADVPFGPTITQAQASDSQVQLTWTAGAPGGSPITGYNVYKGTSAGGEDFAHPVNGSTLVNSPYIVTSLTNGTTYYFVVKAVSSVGEGAPSNEVSATPVTVPAGPTITQAQAGNTTVQLTWTAGSNGGSTILGYNVYQGTSAGMENASPVNGATLVNSPYTVTSLTNGTKYYFVVKAVNSVGEGAASNEVNATPTNNADVGVNKTAPTSVIPGTNLSYSMTVTNSGPATATTVGLSDPLPTNTTFVSETHPSGWTCTKPAVGAGGTYSCSNPSLANGAAGQTFSLVIHVSPNATGSLSNTATVTSDHDNNGMNNSSTATTMVGADHTQGSTGGNVTLGAGSTMINGATIGGNIKVPAGSTLVLLNSTVGGGITGTNAASITVCNTTVGGAVNISGSTGFVLLGDPGDDGCAGNTFRAAMTLSSNQADVEVGHNQTANVSVTGTTGTGPFPDDTGVEIEANHVGGNLGCSGNTPAASNDRQPNTVTGSRTGECASPTF